MRLLRAASDRLLPFVPAFFLAIFGFWCGTFVGGATAAGAAAGHLALVLAVFVFGVPLADPLGLGRRGRLLLGVLALAVIASWIASPVPRAGRVGVPIACLLVGIVAVVARSLRTGPGREWGVRAISLGVAAVACVGIGTWLAGLSPRPALPLGHHNLLAAWLAILLPLAALPAREHGPWRGVGIASSMLALGAIGASLSAAALAAVCLVALVAAVEWGGPRVRRVAVLVVVVVALALGPRAIEIARGRDPSAAARLVYLEAGMRGIAERPWLGWGPGATPWTLGPHLQPIPGTNPPGEAVGDLHSLPIEVAYELGLLGALAALGVAMAFAVARLREDRAAPDPVRRAGLLGLLGAAVTALASGAWAVSALPVAAAISAGAALSGGSREPGRIENAVARAGALVILLFLAPLDLAERSYERALGVVREASIAALDRAIAFDPAFALYRARRAAYRARPTAFDAADARKAAEDAGSTAPFDLLAGALSAEARSPDSGRLLDSACASARLDGIAPFLRLRATPPPIDPVSVAARALLAEPRLAAAVWWRGREGLLARAVARISALDGVELGWRQSFVDAASSLPDRAGPGALLAYGQESEAASFSLHLLRRRPWGSYLGAVPLSERALAHLGLPSAASLPTTSAALFAGPGCGLGDPPARPKS